MAALWETLPGDHGRGTGGGCRPGRSCGGPPWPSGAPLRLATAAAAVRAAMCCAAVRHSARVTACAVCARVAVPADGPRRDRGCPVRTQLCGCGDDAQPAGVCQVPATPSADRSHCRCHGAFPSCGAVHSACPCPQLADVLSSPGVCVRLSGLLSHIAHRCQCVGVTAQPLQSRRRLQAAAGRGVCRLYTINMAGSTEPELLVPVRVYWVVIPGPTSQMCFLPALDRCGAQHVLLATQHSPGPCLDSCLDS